MTFLSLRSFSRLKKVIFIYYNFFNLENDLTDKNAIFMAIYHLKMCCEETAY